MDQDQVINHDIGDWKSQRREISVLYIHVKYCQQYKVR